MGKNGLKMLGVLASLLGFGLTLFTNWVDDKELDIKVAEAVSKAISDISETE